MNQNSVGRGREYGYGNYSGSGPLKTNHLNIRDLDRELAILRRKRDAVQREQQMLTIECDMDRRRQYEHTNRNVSNTYGNVWQPPPPKRVNTSQQPNPWTNTTHSSFGSTSKAMPTKYIPSLFSKKIDPPISMNPIVHPILKNTVTQKLVRSTNVRKDSHLAQVTKKKPKYPPNKLNTYPLKERKDLLSEVTGSQLVKNNQANKLQQTSEMILREDQIPNNQVTGRLELALGNIVKEIRYSCQNDTFKTLISSAKHQRTLKQAVRERIRNVMLNKTVGSVVDIINKYREKFPKESDKDIIELVINSEHPKIETVIGTETPEEFFKKNIDSILEKKIQEMCSHLLKMYTNVRRKTTFAYTNAAEDANRQLGESLKKESIFDDEVAMKVLRGFTGKYVTVEENNVLTRYYTELIEDVLEEKIPEYMLKCKENFMKIFDMDQQFKTLKSMTTKLVKDEIKAKKAEEQTAMNEQTESSDQNRVLEMDITDNIEIDEEVTKDNDMQEKKFIGINEMEEEAVPKNIVLIEHMTGHEITSEASKVEETRKIIPVLKGDIKSSLIFDSSSTASKIIESTIPVTEKTDSPEIIISASPVAENSESPETIKRASPVAIKTELQETIIPATPLAKITESPLTTIKFPETRSTTLVKELPYYVKLIGQPQLPNRAVICEFLNRYQPKSIKKHKSINNLLVVGFVNREDYIKILTANETVLGDVTIIIKASEKINHGKDSINENNEARKDTQKEIDDSNNAQKEIDDSNNAQKEIDDSNNAQKEIDDSNNAQKEIDDSSNTQKQTKNEDKVKEQAKDEDKIKQQAKDQDKPKQHAEDGTRKCVETSDSINNKNQDEEKDLIGKELDDQISDLLFSIKQTNDDINKNNKAPSVELIKAGEDDVKNAETHEGDKAEKISKVNVKGSGRTTPVRASSRLGNVTPSTIRTRRASRLMQE